MNYLGKYLKKRLKEMKMSEREISSRCGISHSYLNQLIKGINPSTKKNISPTLITFEKLSKGFGVSVDYLQKVARGLIENDGNSSSDKEFSNGKEYDVSPELLTQIKDFQSFISDIGLTKENRTEKEWADIILTIKKAVKVHLENHGKEVV